MSCALSGAFEPAPGSVHIFVMADNCHGKTKNLTAKTKTSRQNQKPHGKNKIPHGKTKNLTAKTKYLTAKPKTSRQNQIHHSKNKIALILICRGYLLLREVFGFCCEVFGFAVRSLVLPWGFWFCREVFCFCREVFGFAVKFLFLPWGFRFCREVFCFRREVFGFAVTVVGHRIYIYKECLDEPQRLKSHKLLLLISHRYFRLLPVYVNPGNHGLTLLSYSAYHCVVCT